MSQMLRVMNPERARILEDAQRAGLEVDRHIRVRALRETAAGCVSFEVFADLETAPDAAVFLNALAQGIDDKLTEADGPACDGRGKDEERAARNAKIDGLLERMELLCGRLIDDLAGGPRRMVMVPEAEPTPEQLAAMEAEEAAHKAEWEAHRARVEEIERLTLEKLRREAESDALFAGVVGTVAEGVGEALGAYLDGNETAAAAALARSVGDLVEHFGAEVGPEHKADLREELTITGCNALAMSFEDAAEGEGLGHVRTFAANTARAALDDAQRASVARLRVAALEILDGLASADDGTTRRAVKALARHIDARAVVADSPPPSSDVG